MRSEEKLHCTFEIPGLFFRDSWMTQAQAGHHIPFTLRFNRSRFSPLEGKASSLSVARIFSFSTSSCSDLGMMPRSWHFLKSSDSLKEAGSPDPCFSASIWNTCLQPLQQKE